MEKRIAMVGSSTMMRLRGLRVLPVADRVANVDVVYAREDDYVARLRAPRSRRAWARRRPGAWRR